MSPLLMSLMLISFAGLLALAVYRFVKYRQARGFAAQLLLLIAAFAIIFLLFYTPEEPVVKGSGSNEIYFVIILYFFMLLGMAAHYAYTYFSRPKKERKKFDPGLFVAPVFASPIIFIPLLAALQNAEIDLQNLTAAKTMVFFVAFENGFFWKEYFDNRRKEKEDGTD